MSDTVLKNTGTVTILLSENDPELIAKVLDVQEWQWEVALAN